MAKQQPVYNTAGTHVHLFNPETGGQWECPADPDLLDLYVNKRGWEYAQPRDDSLDGLFDESTAEGADQTGFDPGKASVDEVNAHLAQFASAPGEVERVLELERAGRNRKTVTDPRLPVGEDTNPGD